MATEMILQSITRIAGADLSAKQYLFCKLDTSGQAVVAGAGEKAIGVLQDKDTAGHATTVGVYGVSRVIAGAVVAAGAQVQVGTGAKAITLDTGEPAGIALSPASADGELISVLLKV